MQNRAVFRAYCLLLLFLVVLFLGLSLAKAWAIPEPGGLEETDGWRLVLHEPDGGRREYWLTAQVPAETAEENEENENNADNMGGVLDWRLNEPYLSLRFLAEQTGADLGWFEYHNGSIHTGAAVWCRGGASVVLLLGSGTAFLVAEDGTVQAESQFARPLLIADSLCLPAQLLSVLGLDCQVEAGQVEIWLPEYSENGNLPQKLPAEVWQAVQSELAAFWAEQLGNRLLAAAETKFDPAQAGRTQNVFLAAQALHGWQAAPGEDFSFNAAVGERTPERGYQLAQIFVDKQVQMGYGGGVCQVSSTLYMALRQTELEILERHPHSLPVTYAPAGADATVAWNALDLRWRNNRERPVYLLCRIWGGTLRVEVWEGSAPLELPDIFKI